MDSILTGPYENAITQGFVFLQVITKFLDDLSPAFITLIQNNIALHKSFKEQRIIDRRIRKSKRICRNGHFLIIQIKDQIEIDFQDLTQGQRDDISDLLVYELITQKVIK